MLLATLTHYSQTQQLNDTVSYGILPYHSLQQHNVCSKRAGKKCSLKLLLLHVVCVTVTMAIYLELNIAALRQLDIKSPDIAVIPLHLGSIADIPVTKTRVASNNLVTLTK